VSLGIDSKIISFFPEQHWGFETPQCGKGKMHHTEGFDSAEVLG